MILNLLHKFLKVVQNNLVFLRFNYNRDSHLPTPELNYNDFY